MTKLFLTPKRGDKVILNRDGIESQTCICDVTPRSITVRGINLIKFNRNGQLNKNENRAGRMNWHIRPSTSN